MPKSPDAFRTISEVADWLDVQAHVLRFWESKFSQVKPIKRAGGRRYYRPADMLLLGGIKKLLHDDGLTIKGVQKILREEGMGHVSAMSAPLEEQLAELLEDAARQEEPTVVEEETGVLLDFAPSGADTADAVDAQPDPAPETEDASDLPDFVQKPLDTATDAAETDNLPATDDLASDVASVEEPTPDDETVQAADDTTADVEAPEPDDAAAEAVAEEPIETAQEMAAATKDDAEPALEAAPDTEPEPEATAQDNDPEPQPDETPPAPKPRIIDLPAFTPEAEIAAAPSALTAAFESPGFSAAQARDVAPLLTQLTALRDRMHGARQGGAAKG